MPFCTKCGRQLQDGEVCNCQAQPAASATPVAAPKKNNNIATIIIAIVAIALVLVVVSLFTRSTYKSPLKQITKAFNSKTTDPYKLSLAGIPKDLQKIYKDMAELSDEDLKDTIKETKKETKEKFDELSEEYGNWKVSYKINDKTKVKSAEIKTYKEDLEETAQGIASLIALYEAFGGDAEDTGMSKKQFKQMKKILNSMADYYDGLKIKEAYDLECTFSVKGKDIEDETDVTITVGKVGKDWIMLGYKDGKLRFDDATDFNIYFDNVKSNMLDAVSGALDFGW